MHRPRAAAFVTAVIVLFAAAAVGISGDWYLSCTDPTGHQLAGIDCFQYDATPQSDSALASWVGFVPLVLIGGLAFLTVATLGATGLWRRWQDSKAGLCDWSPSKDPAHYR